MKSFLLILLISSSTYAQNGGTIYSFLGDWQAYATSTDSGCAHHLRVALTEHPSCIRIHGTLSNPDGRGNLKFSEVLCFSNHQRMEPLTPMWRLFLGRQMLPQTLMRTYNTYSSVNERSVDFYNLSRIENFLEAERYFQVALRKSGANAGSKELTINATFNDKAIQRYPSTSSYKISCIYKPYGNIK